jgi:amidohydrolase
LKKIVIVSIVAVFCFSLANGWLFSATKEHDKRIQEVTKEITPDLIKIQEDIHCHPELGFQEKRTAAIVAEYFQKLGLEVRTGIGGTGVFGILRGGKPGPVIAMRGDMDALPVTEEANLPYASKVKVNKDGREVGVMHACGHDFHTTWLMGVANVLARLKKDLPGTVLFIAQPAEEWGDGANEMIKAGVFKDITPQAFFAFHVEDTAKVGFIKYTPGYSGANCDGFSLIVKSKGGHGAHPSDCVDPVVVGSQIVIALQVMISREIDVHNDTVITVGSFHAGSASNVIPQSAELRATIRSYGDEQRQALKEKVERLIKSICAAAGAEYDLSYNFGTIALYNDPALLKEILPTAERFLGGKQFLSEDPPSMGGEDFSYFAKIAPAVMLSMGVLPKDVAKTSVHSPTFVADQAGIPLGVNLMSAIIVDYLNKHKTK